MMSGEQNGRLRGFKFLKSWGCMYHEFITLFGLTPTGFRWIEALKREDKVELSFNSSQTLGGNNLGLGLLLPCGDFAGGAKRANSEVTGPENGGVKFPENLGWVGL